MAQDKLERKTVPCSVQMQRTQIAMIDEEPAHGYNFEEQARKERNRWMVSDAENAPLANTNYILKLCTWSIYNSLVVQRFK